MTAPKILPTESAVNGFAADLRILGDEHSRHSYFIGLVSSATKGAITGFETGDTAVLRNSLSQLLSGIAAAVRVNAEQQR